MEARAIEKHRFTEEHIAFVLRQSEAGTPVAEVVRKSGISERTFYRWKKKYAGLGVADQLCGGRRIRVLTLVDNHTRESLALRVGQHIRRVEVVEVLKRCERPPCAVTQRPVTSPAATLWPRFDVVAVKILLPATGMSGYTAPSLSMAVTGRAPTGKYRFKDWVDT